MPKEPWPTKTVKPSRKHPLANALPRPDDYRARRDWARARLRSRIMRIEAHATEMLKAPDLGAVSFEDIEKNLAEAKAAQVEIKHLEEVIYG